MPPMFSLGYHQCRWNYNDEADVRDVDANFDKHEIPYDVIWLDIEHTDGKRYLTWDDALFPDPTKLQRDIGAKGRKMVMTLSPEPGSLKPTMLKRDIGAKGRRMDLSNPKPFT